MNKRAIQFCDMFVSLWRREKAFGVAKPKVGRSAALAVGYGASSWSKNKANKAADVAFNNLVNKPEVIERLQELGLVKEGREWRDIRGTQS